MKRKAVEQLINETRLADFAETDKEIASLKKKIADNDRLFARVESLLPAFASRCDVEESRYKCVQESIGMLAKRLTASELKVQDMLTFVNEMSTKVEKLIVQVRNMMEHFRDVDKCCEDMQTTLDAAQREVRACWTRVDGLSSPTKKKGTARGTKTVSRRTRRRT